MDNSAAAWGLAVLWLYCTFMLFWALQWWLGRHIQGVALLVFNRPNLAANLYFYLLAPGVILHELSHWLFAKLLFVPTKDLVLFRPQRSPDNNGKGGPITLGYVEIFKTDPLRQSLIGLAPLPVGLLVLLALATLLNFNTGLSSSTLEPNTVWQSITAIPPEIVNSLKQPLNLLWLYFVFTVSNGMLPSRPDRKPWLVGFLLPGSILLALSLTGHLPPLSPEWQHGLRSFIANLTWIFAFAASLNFLLAILIFLVEWMVSRMKKRRVVYK
ncbi:MAG TPA: hypothetical protein VH186_09025 [Chloroflexia bacterium]|nr:hypothetical protein [Chloroflexia bacterium]